MLEGRLSPEFVSDPQTLHGPEAGNARAPIRVFVLAGGVPISRDKLANATGNHRLILLLGEAAHTVLRRIQYAQATVG